MAGTYFSGFLLFVFVLVGVSCGQVDQKKADQYELVWADEFDYVGLPDSLKWSYDTEGNDWGWGNQEEQFYTKRRLANAEVKNGRLYITAIKENYKDRKFTSARLVTKGKGDWLYGKVEVSAKLPQGRGLWPAIWMLPTDWKYGGWPASGEIDIMENVGFMPDTILASVHTKSYHHSIGTQRSDTLTIPSCYDEFHTYQLEWEPDELRAYIDGQHFFTFQNEGTGTDAWPFDQRFHLLLNIAVGGTWGGAHGIDSMIFPRSMEVDYVRVYQKQTRFKSSN
ncbi:family 16 glycosylhydrolase [Sunxiuqinia elliptica]|uniref:Glycosyl hydrolase family 16 n=1 Tax=Sunxiuqinia elliptica TaxID=655355 RepID=A0A4R6H0C6_9BACT|nr:glycoside hydrolase family 16 protein [Sunxiuqinia elliptica]TDO01217.1 glycosyl hydrolase family 16 [Sunxiuqinia elliptica]TDO57728.1 glycosyl hydrolase family 16 [Sunxiuqinia elliptica]